MAESRDERVFKVRRNLSDAGMDDESIEECLKLLDEEKYTALDRLLNSYRKTLLESVHAYNNRIDCLDYFTYTLRKNGGTLT